MHTFADALIAITILSRFMYATPLEYDSKERGWLLAAEENLVGKLSSTLSISDKGVCFFCKLRTGETRSRR